MRPLACLPDRLWPCCPQEQHEASASNRLQFLQNFAADDLNVTEEQKYLQSIGGQFETSLGIPNPPLDFAARAETAALLAGLLQITPTNDEVAAIGNEEAAFEAEFGVSQTAYDAMPSWKRAELLQKILRPSTMIGRRVNLPTRAGGGIGVTRVPTAHDGTVIAPAGVWISSASVGGVALRCPGRLDRSWPLWHHAL